MDHFNQTRDSAMESPEPCLRLFVAFRVPADVRSSLAKVQQRLKGLMRRSRVRWTPIEQIHLTLLFLGSVPVTRIEAVLAGLQEACEPFASVGLRIRGLGSFPNVRRPRVLWAGVAGDVVSLFRVQSAIAATLGQYAEETEEKAYSAHLTLGRFKAVVPPERRLLETTIQAEEGSSFGEWEASEVELIQSELSPSGARHATLRSVALGSRLRPPG
jgi:2'-5' RNA ligase